MRTIYKIFALAAASMPCAAGAQLLPPEPLYRDGTWGLLTFHDESQRTCSLIARQQPASGASDHFLVVYVNRNARRNTEVLRIELVNPPAEYLGPNGTTTALIDLGEVFTRRMTFYLLPSMHPIVATNLRRDDLNYIGAALRPSGRAKSVTFENGTSWRFASPANADLATKLFECWKNAGVATPVTR